MRRQALKMCIVIPLLVGLAGCAATVTALKYKDLEVQTKMSESIFLDPVSAAKKTVWIDVKNTSDKDLDLSALPEVITARGYRIVMDPEQAHYLLQANVLYVGKVSQAAIDQAVGAGFGGPLAGVAIGAGAGAAIGRSPTAVGVGAGVGGLLGAAAETISGALVKAVSYAVITDVQLSERSAVPVTQEQTATLQQGSQTQVHQQVSGTSFWKRYRTRIASSAIKVNLKFEEASPVITRGLVKSLGGIL